MKYKLAKSLKDAGFPIRDARCSLCAKSLNGTCSNCITHSTPTLSELIEACGYPFRALVLHTVNEEKHPEGEWHAKARRPIVGKKFKNQRGKSPEEAVAKLWLELQK